MCVYQVQLIKKKYNIIKLNWNYKIWFYNGKRRRVKKNYLQYMTKPIYRYTDKPYEVLIRKQSSSEISFACFR